MVWKSREEKLPPPSFFSLVVAHLQQAYQGARISRQTMQTLRPFLIEAWRSGRSAAVAAQMTCSCDNHEIVPSPVVGIQIAKGSVRPPKGAQRGDVFGADELRQPPKVERLQKKLERVSREEQKQHSAESRWEKRAQAARSEPTRKEAERKQALALGKRAELLREAKKVEDEISRLRRELQQKATHGSSAPVQARQPPSRPPEVTPPVISPPPGPQPAQGDSGEKKRRGRKPMAKAAEKSSPAQDAAILSAVQGLLPGLASQLAAEIAKEGEKK